MKIELNEEDYGVLIPSVFFQMNKIKNDDIKKKFETTYNKLIRMYMLIKKSNSNINS